MFFLVLLGVFIVEMWGLEPQTLYMQRGNKPFPAFFEFWRKLPKTPYTV
jgi:hypothetical protein